MRGSTMIATLQWLGVVPSFSRPHVSDDNPYSEALFRTLKHTPAYPRLPFADLGSAERWVTRFVNPLRHAERAAPWQRASCPRSSAGPLRASIASKPRALDPHDSQWVSGWPRGPQSRTHPAAGCCMTHATTTLIFTVRKTAYKWIDRFLAGCELTDRSRRPHSSPRATSATLERLSWRLARSILVGGPRSCEPCSCAPTPASSCPRSVRSQPSSNAMGS